MFSKTLFLLTAAFVMAGCVSNDTSDAALRDSALASITIPVFSDQWAGGSLQLATKTTQGCGEFSANILPPTSDRDVTSNIEGDRDIFFHISRTDGELGCDEVKMFYATAGNQYTLNLAIINKQCEITLMEKAPDGTQNKIKTFESFASKVDGVKVCENRDNLY